MKYRIRAYADSDVETLHELTLAAITTIGLAGYSRAQVNAWAGRHDSAERLRERVRSGHMVFVAVDTDDKAAAYALLEPDGHLDMLYCHPDHTRQGLADGLLRAAEDQALICGLAKLYTEASALARPSFERAGYVVTKRRDFTIDHDGQSVPIHNYAMEKSLP
ncbi:GNAT family N-acetyltransferase [Pontixanthobacter aestiaquae]|uniref:GNAT family N-acetyltransferase n=1 Tax=Pontixanthobacter aestiaquae TaxID=1509367 RepID=A0A844Z6S6_9SPHN|nr:GNAT family N-acetyltransferase [Pontixanthobacter aestiaquae]MDN3645494.1 GNAT family N-acetyltransferase [Pontixanthobacter aestiaquae]MXO83508.1 GNAT family N-acetyltransferase [Pontixanthobacter aestiaquae]